MGRFIVRRLLQMAFVLWAVSVLTFFIFQVIPNGDPAERMAGKQPREAQIQAIREEWGFNDNIFVQYFTTMKKVFNGDLISYTTQLPVMDEIVKGLPRTLALAFGAAILWMFVAICFGLYSAVKAGKFADRFLTIIADYVRTARAKGVGERQIMVRHALRNTMIPIVTLWGLDFGAVVGGGAILTETVFDLQGVGQYAAEAVGQLDVPPVLATTMFAAFFIVLLNAIVDIVYAYLDPRIRLQ